MNPELIAAAALMAPGATLSAAVAWSLRGSRTHSAAVRMVLAESAAARTAALDEDGPTPPTEREPAPETAPAPAVRLATVLPFPGASRRAA
ncbi:hypothetical protein OHV05_17250 [Kitasatospora sp. NBC_00070]|uniref:hypothetical protein n=1 Tax=Kitasatospora sp. NBC_00070 TaxID=2975962 RepID=UPI00324B2B64